MKLISLCLIVGNVSEYIRRCLKSFAPIADEIIVVRAIGNAVPDDTLEIAAREFGAITGEYKNAIGHEEWPHVDNFAAARQLSFDLASGEYCFWCDTDDVLEADPQHVRDLAERGEYGAFLMPYDIFGRDLVVQRERMMLRGSGRWRYPVHECFEFITTPQAAEDPSVVVVHLPHLSKSGGNERNLRILQSIPEAEMNTGLRWHLFGELMGAGKTEEAIALAEVILKAPDLGKPERYDLFLNLALAIKDPAHKEAVLHEAYRTDPTRREALGVLAGMMMDHGLPQNALAYARQMMATIRPSAAAWNDRLGFYGWIADDIYAQALRVNGRAEDAETVRQHALRIAGGPVIALIHATRGRPLQAVQARKKWLDLAAHPERIEHIFVFDDDDCASRALRRMHHLEIPAGGGCVAAWNSGALATSAPILIQLSDDWTPPPRWDIEVVKRLSRQHDGGHSLSESRVLAVSDGHREDQLLCMAILTRARWLEQSVCLPNFAGPVMFDPRFKGVYSDNWFTHCAYRDGVVVEARDLVFTHAHPAFDPFVKIDQTYAEQNRPERYAEGKEVFEHLAAEPVPAFMWRNIPGWTDFTDLYGQFAHILEKGDTFVEVGAYKGRSICFLAEALRARSWEGYLFAIDAWNPEAPEGASLEEFNENLAKARVSSIAFPLREDSADAAKFFENCAIVFIDASHKYEDVARDIAAWWPKVKRGGILSGHDYDCADVRRAVHEFFDPLGIPVKAASARCWMVGKGGK